jgi:hypothetical protein
VLATYDGSGNATGIHLYTNGTADDGTTTTNGTWPDSGIIPSSPAAPPIFGGRWGSNSAVLNGYLAECMIYDHVLSAAERTAESGRITAKYGLAG